MKEENILNKILFGGKREGQRDINQPENQPYYSALSGVRSQAFAEWYSEQGGEFVLSELEKETKDKLEVLVNMPIRSLDDMFKLVSFRQNIIDDINWYVKIVSSFNQHKKQKEE